MKPRTLFDKIWDYHLINTQKDGASLIYIDRHLVHEVTSPQAFEGLRMSGRKVSSPQRTLAVADHNVPTSDRSGGIEDEESRIQVEALDKNVAEFGVPYFNMMDVRQGIVHVIGPEQGFTQPGMTIVCGDSHTATHGAFGALAFGIGTSEVEHVLATQTLIQKPAKNMLVNVEGELQQGVSAKDSSEIINAIYATFNGVFKMSQTISGLVETSSSLARVILKDGNFITQSLQRSSLESSKIDIAKTVGSSFLNIDANVEHTGSYPGWEPNTNSPILDIMTSIYKSMFHEDPKVQACHAGLECGILGQHYPDMEMISFGPNIKGAHSPDERAQISSAQKYWKFVLEILKEIPKK